MSTIPCLISASLLLSVYLTIPVYGMNNHSTSNTSSSSSSGIFASAPPPPPPYAAAAATISEAMSTSSMVSSAASAASVAMPPIAPTPDGLHRRRPAASGEAFGPIGAVSDQERMHNAVMYGQADTVRTLLDRGVSPLTRVNGVSVFETSIRLNRPDIARMFLSHRVRPETGSQGAGHRYVIDANMPILSNGMTPLEVAITSGHSEMVAMLVDQWRQWTENSVDVNRVGNDGSYPIHMAAAARSNGLRMLQLLINAGADRTRLNANGRSILEIATAYGNNDIVQYLSPAPRSNCSCTDCAVGCSVSCCVVCGLVIAISIIDDWMKHHRRRY